MTKTAIPPQRPERKSTTLFSCHASDARAVFLAGTFNDWDPQATPMVKGTGGNWSVAVELKPGHYEYKFVVDGEWCCAPGCETAHQGCPKCVANPLGTMNRVVEVA